MFERTRERAPQNSGKGNEKLLSIREVSARTGVPAHTLRFWEKEMPDILCPARTPGGQRRYNEEMMERVLMIKRLSDEKRYSLAVIREHLGVVHGPVESPACIRNDARTERAVERIVDEIADLLKEKLILLLEAGNIAKDGNGQE